MTTTYSSRTFGSDPGRIAATFGLEIFFTPTRPPAWIWIGSARVSHHFQTTSNGLRLQLQSGFGAGVATLTDRESSLAQPLVIEGDEVVVNGSDLARLIQAGSLLCDILVVNTNNEGYVMTLVLSANGSADLYVF